MAYENSHLFAAEQIRRSIDTLKIQEIIATNIYHYYIGAVFPDILYFGRDRKIYEMGENKERLSEYWLNQIKQWTLNPIMFDH